MAIKKTPTKTVKKKASVKEVKPKVVKEAKKEKKETKEIKEIKKETKVVKIEFEGKYYYALGRRKSSVAQVRLYAAGKESKGVVVNGKKAKEYFTIERHSELVSAPLIAAGLAEKFDVSVKVSGGGIMGQAEAARLGVARALVVYDENLKKTLKDMGHLTRDARVVERKKPGKKKARRSPQWAKR